MDHSAEEVFKSPPKAKEIKTSMSSILTPHQRFAYADDLHSQAIELNDLSTNLRATADELDLKAELFRSIATAFQVSAQDDRAWILSKLEELLVFYGDLPDNFTNKSKYIGKLGRLYLAAEEGRATPEALEKTRLWLDKRKNKGRLTENDIAHTDTNQVSVTSTDGVLVDAESSNAAEPGKLIDSGSAESPLDLASNDDFLGASQESLVKRKRSESTDIEMEGRLGKRMRNEVAITIPDIDGGPFSGQNDLKYSPDDHIGVGQQHADIAMVAEAVDDLQSESLPEIYDEEF